MNTLWIILIALVFYLFLERRILPRLNKLPKPESQVNALFRVLGIVFVNYVRRFSKIVFYTFFILWGGIALLVYTFPTPEDSIAISQYFITALVGLEGTLQEFKPAWAMWSLIGLSGLLIILGVRKAIRYINLIADRLIEDSGQEITDEALHHGVLQELSLIGERKQQNPLLIRLLMSEGMVRTINKSTGVIGTLGVLFLLLTFISVSSPLTLADLGGLGNQITEIQVGQEARELETALSDLTNVDDGTSSTLTRSNRLFIRRLSLDVERKILQKMAPGFKNNPYLSEEVQVNAFRQKILSEHSNSLSSNTGIRSLEIGGPEVSPVISQYYDEFGRQMGLNELQTEAGIELERRITNYVMNNPEEWNLRKTALSNYFDSFSKPATVHQVAGGVLYNSLFNLDFGDSNNEGEVAYNKPWPMISKSLLSLWVKNSSQKWIRDFTTSDVSIEESFENITKATSFADDFIQYGFGDETGLHLAGPPISPSQLIQSSADFPPTISHQPLRTTQQNATRQIIEEWSNAREVHPRKYADAAANYSTWFPGQEGMAGASLGGQLMGYSAEERASMVGHMNRTDPNFGKRRGWLARSWRGFVRSIRRVRFRRRNGLIIGLPPLTWENEGVDFRDIHWEWKGNQIEVFLTRADGEILSAGSYDPATIYQALIFVADSRPMAVTMTDAYPLPDRKVLLHPALVNTPLGCDALGVDRLVKNFAGWDHPQVGEALRLFDNQEYLFYQIAKFMAYNSMSFKSEDDKVYFLDSLISHVEPLWPEIYDRMSEKGFYEDPLHSPYSIKSANYHPEIIEAAQKAFEDSGGSFEQFKDELFECKFEASPINYDAFNSGGWRTLQLTQSKILPGVQEMPYNIDPNLDFLKLRERLYPLDFIWQVTYTYTHPDSVFATDGWEFQSLNEQNIVDDAVWEGVQADPELRGMVERMQSFTLAQRLFRCGLYGFLGEDFPREKLYQLMQATKAYQQISITPTWDLTMNRNELWQYAQNNNDIDWTYLDKLATAQGLWDNKNTNPCR